MSDNKKYYYLKLKETFFDSEEMKILESQKNGIEYQNLYLKLCLVSLKSEGKLIFKDCIPYDINMISTVLRMNIDTVKTGLEILSKLKLIEVLPSGVIYMSDIQTLIGQSSTEGERVKKYRDRIKNEGSTKSVQMYEKRTPELELEIELEKEIELESSSEQEKPVQAETETNTLPEKSLKTDPILYANDTEIGRITNQFFDLIMSEVKPPTWKNKKPNLENWYADIEKLHRIDGQPPGLITQVVEWVVKDPFWSRNVLSGATLRKQFDRLVLQMRQPENFGAGKSPPKLFRNRDPFLESLPKEMLDKFIKNQTLEIGHDNT